MDRLQSNTSCFGQHWQATRSAALRGQWQLAGHSSQRAEQLAQCGGTIHMLQQPGGLSLQRGHAEVPGDIQVRVKRFDRVTRQHKLLGTARGTSIKPQQAYTPT